jgi:hypothetical protein
MTRQPCCRQIRLSMGSMMKGPFQFVNSYFLPLINQIAHIHGEFNPSEVQKNCLPTSYLGYFMRDTIDTFVNIDSTDCCLLNSDVPPGHQESLRQQVR